MASVQPGDGDTGAFSVKSCHSTIPSPRPAGPLKRNFAISLPAQLAVAAKEMVYDVGASISPSTGMLIVPSRAFDASNHFNWKGDPVVRLRTVTVKLS